MPISLTQGEAVQWLTRALQLVRDVRDDLVRDEEQINVNRKVNITQKILN